MTPIYTVTTPENLTLSYRLAGRATRAFALCVDLVVMGAVLQGSVWALSALELVASSAATALWIIAAFAVQWGYGALCEWRFGGRTLGKRLCGITVIDATGLRITFAQAALRNLLRLADLLPGFHLFGALVSLADAQGRRLGDLAARTLVVEDDRPPNIAPTFRLAPEPSSAPLRGLASRLSTAERRATLALCNALDQLPLSDRLALCEMLAAHIALQYGYLRPAHVTAERFLLQIDQAARTALA